MTVSVKVSKSVPSLPSSTVTVICALPFWSGCTSKVNSPLPLPVELTATCTSVTSLLCALKVKLCPFVAMSTSVAASSMVLSTSSSVLWSPMGTNSGGSLTGCTVRVKSSL